MSRPTPWTRLAGVLAIAGLLLALGGLSFARRVGAARPVLGLTWSDSAAGPLVVAVVEGSPAWSAGVRPGDVLVRVGGRPVRGLLEARELPWTLAAGNGARLELLRGSRTTVVDLAPSYRPRLERYGYLSIVGLAFLVSGVFIALRWPDVRGGALYALLAATFYTQLVFSHTGRADALDWSVYWFDVTAGTFAPALLLHLALALSRRAVAAPRLAVTLAYLPAGLLLAGALWLSPAVLGGAYRFDDPVLAEEIRERLEVLFLAVAVPLAVTVLFRSYSRSASTLHRSRMRWLLSGLVAGLVPFVAFYAVPFAIGASDLPPWAALLSVIPMLIVPATFTAALARYRLHDLSLLVRRGLSEVTAVFFTMAVYAAARETAEGLPALSGSSARYVGILLAMIAYAPLRNWVRSGVDRAFYRERYSYRATLLDWARELAAETDLDSLLSRLRERVRNTLDVREARVLLRSGDAAFEPAGDGTGKGGFEIDRELVRRLEREPAVYLEVGAVARLPWARWLFAMKVEGRLTALLAITDRHAPDEPLSSEDRALLSTLAAHAATAIEAARLVREVRRRADEVERLHERQERILETSAVGLLLTGDDGRILAWNRALEEIYRLPRQEAIGRRLSEVFPLQIVRRIAREFASAPADEQVRIYRIPLVNQAGERLVVNLTLAPALPDEEGAANRVITVDDVSDRVKLEQQVLRQERLASLGMLAAGVAHEVNTPLTGISSYAQLLLEELPVDDPRRGTLRKIDDQTRRASEIVNSLLNLARPERGTYEELSINDTIRDVLKLFEPQIRGREIRVDARYDDTEPRIHGHRAKLQQVLLNLLLNARDALGRGGRIRVVTQHAAGRVAIDVVDDGVGVPEEDLQRVFDPFFTTKGRGKGTGLGLSISYGIVQEHGGEIHVESAPGEFTRFRVELPVGRTAQALA